MQRDLRGGWHNFEPKRRGFRAVRPLYRLEMALEAHQKPLGEEFHFTPDYGVLLVVGKGLVRSTSTAVLILWIY